MDFSASTVGVNQFLTLNLVSYLHPRLLRGLFLWRTPSGTGWRGARECGRSGQRCRRLQYLGRHVPNDSLPPSFVHTLLPSQSQRQELAEGKKRSHGLACVRPGLTSMRADGLLTRSSLTISHEAFRHRWRQALTAVNELMSSYLWGSSL